MKELFEAVRANDAARVEALVAADPTLAIFAAAMTGDIEKLEAMLTGNRSLVTAVSTDGWTALHLAAFFGQEAAARALLNKGASAKMRSTNAMTNLAIHAAAAGKHTALVRLLLEHGTPANAQQHGGWTALHAAAQHGDVDMARVLVANGADVGARADNQQRPLDLAVLKAHQSMVDFLESNGAAL
jgi:uncharacterized protein